MSDSPFTEQELATLWESLQYHSGSLSCLLQRDPPSQFAGHVSQLPERIAELQRLARKIEQILIDHEKGKL